MTSPAPGGGAGGRRSSIAGRIESLGLPVILQFLSQKEKTGRLTLTRREGQGLIVFREGRIVAVASDGVRDTFGNMLVCRGLISEADLMESIERQHLSLERKRLGALLVEAGKVTVEDVERLVHDQMKGELTALMAWPAGFFRFDATRVEGTHDVELSTQEFVSEGMSAERLLLSLIQQDEAGAPASDESQGRPPDSDPEAEPVPDVGEVLSSLPVPALRGEVTLTLMRFAEQTVLRGVLYLVRGGELTALIEYGFGKGGRNSEESLPGLRLEMSEAQLLADAMQNKRSFLGRVGATRGNSGLLRILGGPSEELLAIPLVVGDVAVGVFCGDNGPKGGAIRGVRPLELVVAEAGVEMGRAAIEAQLESYEAPSPGTDQPPGD